MKGTDWILIGTLVFIAFLINSGQTYPSQAAATQPFLQTAQTPEDPYAGFSTEAFRVIAVDIAGQTEDDFGKTFAVKCLSANKVSKKFNGYGVSTDLIVVSARFRVLMTGGTKWSKDFDVSETIDAAQFQGLTDADTVSRIVRTLKEQIQADRDSISVLKKAYH